MTAGTPATVIPVKVCVCVCVTANNKMEHRNALFQYNAVSATCINHKGGKRHIKLTD